jgi:hypothetical protein
MMKSQKVESPNEMAEFFAKVTEHAQGVIEKGLLLPGSLQYRKGKDMMHLDFAGVLMDLNMMPENAKENPGVFIEGFIRKFVGAISYHLSASHKFRVQSSPTTRCGDVWMIQFFMEPVYVGVKTDNDAVKH